MSISLEIEKLHNMKKNNIITEEEYKTAKEKLLSELGRKDTETHSGKGARSSVDDNTWSMLIHLSQFCSWVMPLAGLIVPIILWQIRKKESKFIDDNGKIVINWVLSFIIYFAVSVMLSIIIIGIPILLLLILLGIIFPIIGAIKANDGLLWSYPLSIRFFS